MGKMKSTPNYIGCVQRASNGNAKKERNRKISVSQHDLDQSTKLIKGFEPSFSAT